MTSSPDLIHELRASRPSAPLELRARVREIAAEQPARAPWASWRFPVRRGHARRRPGRGRARVRERRRARARALGRPRPQALQRQAALAADRALRGKTGELAPERAGDPRIRSTSDADGRSRAARQRDAHRRGRRLRRRLARRAGRARPHALARRLRRLVVGRDRRGGKRVDHRSRPGREGAGRDHRALRARPHRLAAGHDRRPAGRRSTSSSGARRRVRAQIARIRARLESETLDAQTEAVLRARLQTLRGELTGAPHGHLVHRTPRRACRRSSSRS